MKEFNDLMDAIKKREIPRKLQLASKIFGYPKNAKDDDEARKIIDGATQHALNDVLAHDEELNDLFCNFAYKSAMKAVIKELDIKVSPKGEENKVGEFLKNLIDEIFD